MARRRPAGADRVHHRAQRVQDVRRRLGGERPHGQGRRADPRLVRGPADQRAHRRRAAPSRPDPADRLRGGADRPVARRPHRAAVRPPRQAAGDDRVARRPRAVDARDRGRPAVRPRRRRRRLRRLRRAHRRRGRPGRGHRPRPPARAHRGQRGERQPRPAGARRGAGRAHRLARARRSASTPDASTTSGCGSPRRCAGWSRSTSPWRSSTPAPTAARRAVSSRRASGSSASCSIASRTARPGACSLPELHAEVPDDRLREVDRDRRGDPVPPGARVPVRRLHAADDRRPRRAVPRRVVAADAELRRRRRVPTVRPRRERAAPVDDAHAQLPSAPDVRPRRRAGGDRADADGRSAERRDRPCPGPARRRVGTHRRSRRG